MQILAEKAAQAGVHVSVETKLVTGAPYTAEAATESIQVLADGNRIVRRTTARVYRDGKGRTRRETLGPDGEVRSIVISDPAGGKSFSVDPGTNTVHHTGVATFTTISDEGKLKVAQGMELKAAQQEHVSSAGAMTWVTASDHATRDPRPRRRTSGSGPSRV